MTSLRVVIIDNFDSYAYNLFQRIGELTGTRATVFRNDETTVEEVKSLSPTHLILSPGPGNPENPAYFGICRELILTLGKQIPTLGVCLGHQGIAAAFGARVVKAPQVMHGKASAIHHSQEGIFRGLPVPFMAMRYHSLIVAEDTLPKEFAVTARTTDGLIMGISHREFPLHGVQFHPESIGTREGPALLRHFLEQSQRNSGLSKQGRNG